MVEDEESEMPRIRVEEEPELLFKIERKIPHRGADRQKKKLFNNE